MAQKKQHGVQNALCDRANFTLSVLSFQLAFALSISSLSKSPGGNILLYQVFSDYRRMVKAIIKAAKRWHYCNEMLNNSKNSKKTWQIINELRGKKKRQTKPPFIIDNQRIDNRSRHGSTGGGVRGLSPPPPPPPSWMVQNQN